MEYYGIDKNQMLQVDSAVTCMLINLLKYKFNPWTKNKHK